MASESWLLLVMLGWLERAVRSILRLCLFLFITHVSTGGTMGSLQEARQAWVYHSIGQVCVGHGGPDPCGPQPTGPHLFSLVFLFCSLHWAFVPQLHYPSIRHSFSKLSEPPDTWQFRSMLDIHFDLLLYQVRHTQAPACQDHDPSFTFYHYQHCTTSYLYPHD